MTNDLREGARLYSRLLNYVRPHWRIFIGALVATAIAGAMEPAVAALMKPLLDDGIRPDVGPWEKIVLPLAVVGIFIVRGVFGFLGDYGMAWISNGVVQDIRNDMFRRVLRLPSAYHEKTPSSQTISQIVNDVNGVSGAATSVVTSLIQDSVAVIVLLGWLFYLNWKLTLVTFAMMGVIGVAVRAYSKRMRRLSRGQQEANALVMHVLSEAMHSLKVIRIFGGEAYENKRFADSTSLQRKFAMKSTIASASIGQIVRLFAAIALAIVIAAVMHQVADEETTVGGFVSFITAMLMLIPSLKRLSDINAPLQRGLAAAESIFSLIDQVDEEDRGTTELTSPRGHIRFEQVSFTYPQAEVPALARIDLEVAPGETVALVGASGSGKTTITSLLARLHSPTQGRILIDGTDISTITLRSLRRNIALVSQDVTLFNDTVLANIAYGEQHSAPLEKVEAAAAAANALEFIKALPEGFATVIGENGNRLSGGQRQRLAIARAILKDAPILILDEATSALDNESERLVQDALENLMKQRTTLVIAHRLSTIQNSDKIVVLSRGRIVESGKHAELAARNGAYAQLLHSQPETVAEK